MCKKLRNTFPIKRGEEGGELDSESAKYGKNNKNGKLFQLKSLPKVNLDKYVNSILLKENKRPEIGLIC